MRSMPRPGAAPRCPWCNTPMNAVTSIAPLLHEPGLIAYECPQCGYVTSVLVPADTSGKEKSG